MKNKTVLILYIVTFSMILMIANAASSHNSFYLVIQNVNCHFSNFILFLSNVTVYFSTFLPDGTNLSNLLKIPFSHSSPNPFREDELLLSDGNLIWMYLSCLLIFTTIPSPNSLQKTNHYQPHSLPTADYRTASHIGFFGLWCPSRRLRRLCACRCRYRKTRIFVALELEDGIVHQRCVEDTFLNKPGSN